MPPSPSSTPCATRSGEGAAAEPVPGPGTVAYDAGMPKRLPSFDADETVGGFVPVCPHCDQPLEGVARQAVDVSLGKAYVWACGRCRKVLGVSHRKGFWMG
jgi:hypothetical protein